MSVIRTNNNSTLKKRKMLQETKLFDGIFTRAWSTGLTEPGKRTVKHNNKRREENRYLTVCHVGFKSETMYFLIYGVYDFSAN